MKKPKRLTQQQQLMAALRRMKIGWELEPWMDDYGTGSKGTYLTLRASDGGADGWVFSFERRRTQ